jgi:transglutaminase-like putative cysteine protease
VLSPSADDAEGAVLALCRAIHDRITYRRRLEKGVQSPADTLALASGSCRDVATLMMEAARAAGLAARFASGYLHAGASLTGNASTHAWTEVYLPLLGWRGFDPTMGTAVDARHIVTGVSHHPRGVMPVSGSFDGTAADHAGLTVSVLTAEESDTAA